MKKTLFIIAACALAAVSCQKESAVEKEIKTEGIITVTADIAQFGGDTKTSFNGSDATPKPLWSTGDEIKLFDSAGKYALYTLSTGAGQAVGTFTQTSSESGFAIENFACAYYPAANATAYTHGTGITATIPATQAYTTANSGDTGTNAGTFAPGAAPMVGTGTLNAETGNLGLTFKNVFGILQLNFTGSETIKQIDVIGAANLSGTATITTGDVPTCTISSGQKYVTLTIEESKRFALTGTSTAFYIAVPAGDNLISKVGVTTTAAGYNKSMSPAKTIARSSILSLSSIAVSSMTSGAIYQEAPDMTPVTLSLTISGSSKDVVWAPVNCGYEPTNYTYGKLYQWGRHDGCGYNDGSTYTETTIQETSSNKERVSLVNEDPYIFYKESYGDWCSTTYYNLWDSSISAACTESGHIPTKTDRDPCPSGWRVPTYGELNALINNTGESGIIQGWDGTAKGYYLNGSGTGTSSSANTILLPAAGNRYYPSGQAMNRGARGYYWCSSALNSGSAYLLYFSSTEGSKMNKFDRSNGYSVRCIQE